MNFTDDELRALWKEFLAQGQYSRVLLEVQDKYPEEKSFTVKFEQIIEYNGKFAEDILEYPEKCIAIGEEEIKSYLDTKIRIHLRLSQIPDKLLTEIRKLRTAHLGKFVSLRGIVRRATEVRPMLKIGAFKCSDCGALTLQEQDSLRIKQPEKCSACGKPKGKIKFTLEMHDSEFEDYQSIEIQDVPESLRGGEQPQRITAELRDDIAGTVVPGDRIVINGILRAREVRIQNIQSTEFKMYIDVNTVDREQKEISSVEITDEDIEEIKELARSGDVIENIRRSLAPTIYDTPSIKVIKEALVLQMFGGVGKKMKDGTKIRGDIHILLVGDPGTAKSQLLQKMSELAPRGIYTSGKASSAAGLTATAVKDETGHWTLEAGALVLADLGLAAIDEVDKMSNIDRDSIYQAMEQQIISVTKAGIYATLMSRCAILGAANPKYGRFDRLEPLTSQIDMPPPLLSRFDVIFKILDTPEENTDKAMAKHVLNTHLMGEKIMLGDIEGNADYQEIIDPDLIKKYVHYAKDHIIPVLSDDAKEMIIKKYMDMRNQFLTTKKVAITPRQLEAMIRLAEASARARLSEVITMEDAARAIRVVDYFIKDVATDENTPDIDLISSGISSSKRNIIFEVKRAIRELENDIGYATMDEIIAKVKEMSNEDEEKIKKIVEDLNKRGDIYRDTSNRYRKVK